jgi:COMPASS component BRE2
LTASTDRGFRSARANVSVREGTWYYEIKVERGDGDIGVGKGTGGGEVPNAHVRVGWGRREAILDAPVGLDAYSYGLRDVGCEKVHLSRRKPYGDPSRHFKTGDIIGCLITLPPRPKVEHRDISDPAVIRRTRAPLKFKGQMYLESEEYRPAREMEAKVDREGKLVREAEEAARLATIDTNIEDMEGQGAKISKGKGKSKQKQTSKTKSKAVVSAINEVDRTPTTLPGSSISFYLNGQPINDEPAFKDLYDFIPLPPLSGTVHSAPHKKFEPVKGLQHDDGTLGYYPMISVFGRGKLKVNFGPEWHAPPANLGEVRPMCDRYDEFREEEREQDELDEQEWIERITQEMKEAEDKRESLMKRKLAADLRKEKSGGGRGRGRGRGGSNSTPTPRSRLGTESTPGPWVGQTPSSPQSESVLSMGIKMEDNTSVLGDGESRAASEKPDRDVSLGLDVDAEGEADAEGEVDTGLEDAVGEEDKPIVWD